MVLSAEKLVNWPVSWWRSWANPPQDLTDSAVCTPDPEPRYLCCWDPVVLSQAVDSHLLCWPPEITVSLECHKLKVMKNKHSETTDLQENEARDHPGWRNLWSDVGWRGVMTTTIFCSDHIFGHVLSHTIYMVWNGFVSGVTRDTGCNFDVKISPELFGAKYVCAHSPLSWGRFDTGFRVCRNRLICNTVLGGTASRYFYCD